MSLAFLSLTQRSNSQPTPALAETERIFLTHNRARYDLSNQMTAIYLELDRQNRLSLALLDDDLGWQVRNVMFGTGLLESTPSHPVFPKTLERLMCKLNPGVCRLSVEGAAHWNNRRGTQLCLPAPNWYDARKLVHVATLPAAGAMQVLDERFGTCAVADPPCQDYITSRLAFPDSQDRIVVFALSKARLESVEAARSCAEAPSMGALSTLLTQRGLTYVDAPLVSRLPPGIREAALRRAPAPLLEIPKHASYVEAPPASSSEAPEPPHARPPRPPETASASYASLVFPSRESAEATALDVRYMFFGRLDKTLSAPGRPTGRTTLASVNAVVRGSSPPNPPPPPPANPERHFKSQALVDIDLTPFPGLASSSAGSVGVLRPAVRVLIFDFDPNGCHPVIRKATSCASPEMPLPLWEHIDQELRPIELNHANHIAGLIAGSYGIGVDPDARLDLVSLILEKGKSPVFNEHLRELFTATLGDMKAAVRVVNLSIELNSQDKDLNKQLADEFNMFPNVLFVVAAGDRGGLLEAGCYNIPACLVDATHDNLLVVGGAKLVGQQWIVDENSTYSPERVLLMAPSRHILSAGHDADALGWMNGTSQSAALVSGVAARLSASATSPTSPATGVPIRNRLLATALFPSTLDGMTKSGLLDADRALDLNDQVIVYRDAKNPTGPLQEIRGNLVTIWGGPPGYPTRVSFKQSGSPRLDLDLCQHVYRLHKRSDGTWIVVYDPHRLQDSHWTELQITRGALLLDMKQKLEIVDAHGKSQQISLADELIDFYDRFSLEPACTPPPPAE
jgi:hypothetical protein